MSGLERAAVRLSVRLSVCLVIVMVCLRLYSTEWMLLDSLMAELLHCLSLWSIFQRLYQSLGVRSV